MDLQAAESLTQDLMSEFGLHDWSFKFGNAKQEFGYCDIKKKIISLSSCLVELNDIAVVEDTIRHEIAHALAGPDHHHDWYWRQKCIQVGAIPERCYDADEVTEPEGRYVYKCSTCQREWRHFKRLTRKHFCNTCSNRFGMYSPRALLTLVSSGDGLSKLFAELETS